MKIVRFYDLNTKVNEPHEIGQISWDGQKFSAQPDNMAGVLNAVLRAPKEGRMRRVRKEDDAETWLNALRYQYKSAYFAASEPVDEGEIHESLTYGLDDPNRVLVELLESGFSGTKVDRLGREYHYLDGRRIRQPEDVPEAHLAHMDRLVVSQARAGLRRLTRTAPVSELEPQEGEAPWLHKARLHEMVESKIDQMLQTNTEHVDAGALERYGSHLKQVARKMSTGMLKRWHANVKKIGLFNSTDQVTEQWLNLTGRKMADKSKVSGMWSPVTEGKRGSGSLFLDGGDDDEKTQGTYAHEFSHAIDGHEEYSSSASWYEAWKAEIDQQGSPLSSYARIKPIEGWAEFGRLLLTKPDEAKRFPKCLAVWQSFGLMDQSQKEKKVAVLGLAGDPVHNGHVNLAKHVLEHGNFDEVWLMPAHEHAFGKAMIDPEHRMAMMEKAIQGVPGLKASDFEIKHGMSGRAIDTVAKLQEEHPGIKFSWVIGQDNANDFHKWHRSKELAQKVPFVVVPRQGVTAQETASWSDQAPHRVLPALPAGNEISSSNVRHRLHSGEDVSSLLHPEVLAHIRKHKLYSSHHRESLSLMEANGKPDDEQRWDKPDTPVPVDFATERNRPESDKMPMPSFGKKPALKLPKPEAPSPEEPAPQAAAPKPEAPPLIQPVGERAVAPVIPKAAPLPARRPQPTGAQSSAAKPAQLPVGPQGTPDKQEAMNTINGLAYEIKTGRRAADSIDPDDLEDQMGLSSDGLLSVAKDLGIRTSGDPRFVARDIVDYLSRNEGIMHGHPVDAAANEIQKLTGQAGKPDATFDDERLRQLLDKNLGLDENDYKELAQRFGLDPAEADVHGVVDHVRQQYKPVPKPVSTPELELQQGEEPKAYEQRLLGAVHGRLDELIEHSFKTKASDAAFLPDEYRQEMTEALKGVVSKATTPLLKRVHANLKEIEFASSEMMVHRRAEKIAGEPVTDGNVIAFWLPDEQRLVIDSRDASYRDDTYAHELGHVLDNNDYSTTGAWERAWLKEIKQQGEPLSVYAALNPQEGWAEFNRLILTKPAEVEKFSECIKVWQKFGLAQLSAPNEGKGAEQVAPQQASATQRPEIQAMQHQKLPTELETDASDEERQAAIDHALTLAPPDAKKIRQLYDVAGKNLDITPEQIEQTLAPLAQMSAKQLAATAEAMQILRTGKNKAQVIAAIKQKILDRRSGAQKARMIDQGE